MDQTTSRELTELCRRVNEWRKREGGGRGSRIPASLWDDAVRVAQVEGLYATARATRFNYERLKDRVAAVQGAGAMVAGAAEDEAGRHGASPRFVAVQVAEPRAGSHATIELVGREGERMRVEVVGDLDLAGLVQTFWRRAS